MITNPARYEQWFFFVKKKRKTCFTDIVVK